MDRRRRAGGLLSAGPRTIDRRYRDPLDAIWRTAAARIGFAVERSAEVFAGTDGAGRIVIGAAETLDADDSLAQMILHELCHALVEGPAGAAREDWGLCNRTDRDVPRERAALRVQAALADRVGLRAFLAPTTEHRRFFDALGEDPLADAPETERAPAAEAIGRAGRPPFAPHVGDALDATAAVVRAVRAHGAGDATLYDA